MNTTLSRDTFKTTTDMVKNEIECVIPSVDSIKVIEKDAFKDWECLEYVYIPPTIREVEENAFNYEKIKYIFADKKATIFKGNIGNAKIIQITDQSKELFELLIDVLNIKEKLNFNPQEVDKVKESITDKIDTFKVDIEEKEKDLDSIRKDIIEKTETVKGISTQSQETINLILEKYYETIKKGATEVLEQQVSEMNAQYVEILKKLTQEASELFAKHEESSRSQSEQLKRIREELQNVESKRKSLRESILKTAEQLDKSLDDAEEFINSLKQNMISEVVKEACEQVKKINPCKQIVINMGDVKKKFNSKELFHQDFEKVLKLVLAHKPLLLKGPAGSGKNVILEQIAKAMQLQFYYLNDVTDEYKVMGFVDANGNFKETQFFKAFTKGGIMFIDEIDNSNPSALLAINAAIGTGHNHYMAFPDGNFYQAHKDFYLVAAANTFGTGADAIYSGRQALDGATLNRFIPIVIDYDKQLERQLVRNTDILNLYWDVRKVVNDNQMRHVISTRNIKNADDLLEVGQFELGDIFDWTIIQGLDKSSLRILASKLSGNDRYSLKFLEHLRNSYQIDRNEYNSYNQTSRDNGYSSYDDDDDYDNAYSRRNRGYY